MSNRLDSMFRSALQYAAAYEDYKTRGVVPTLNPHDPEWDGSEPWQVQHYFDVGEDALGVIVAALSSTERQFPRTILDFPSGSGRVTRQLRAFFPDAEIWVCDIDAEHLRFCAAQFGAKPALSQHDLTNVRFEVDFDLIFCGSLLTHLPARPATEALSLVSQSLSATGIGIVTVHGRHSSYIQRNRWKYIDDESFAIAEREASATGYGFVEYRSQKRQRFNHTGEYGVALVQPSWIVARLESNPAIRVLGYRERQWDDHQDVVVFGRPGVDD
jgi:hypothetical protein